METSINKVSPVINDEFLMRAVTLECTQDIDRILKEAPSSKRFSKHALNSSLHMACKLRSKSIVRYLLQAGAGVGHRDDNGNTPLLACVQQNIADIAQHRNLELVQLLLTHGADANAGNLSRETALYISITSSVNLAKMLLGHKDFDLSKDRNDLLHAAVQTGDIELVQLLLDAGEDVNLALWFYSDSKAPLIENFDHSGGPMMTWRGVQINVFHLVTDRSNPLDMVAIDYTIADPTNEVAYDVGFDDFYDIREKTPLMLSYHRGVINLLLDSGADVNKRVDNSTHLLNLLSRSYINQLRSKLGLSPFSTDYARDRAVLFDHLGQTMLLLLQHGANVDDADSRGRTALIMASEMNSTGDMLKLLLSFESNINRQDVSGKTALHHAIERGMSENLRILIDSGADVNLITKDGLSPIHQCMKYSMHGQGLTMLLDNGADVNMEDEAGNNVLMAALHIGCSTGLIERLITARADVNHRNKEGLTPLMLVSQRSPNLEIYKILLEAHADIKRVAGTERNRKTALSILLNTHGLDEIRNAEFLLDHGATSVFINPEILHRAIILGEENLVGKLILKGLPSANIRFRRRLTAWRSRYLSPLSVALLMEKTHLVHYFLDIAFLTESDIPTLSRNASVLDTIFSFNERCFPLVQEISSRPLALSTLSFIKISAALGTDDREEKVSATQLPMILQERLLFRTKPLPVRDEMCVPYELSNYSDELLHALAQNNPLHKREENCHCGHDEYNSSEIFSDGEDTRDDVIYCYDKVESGDDDIQ